MNKCNKCTSVAYWSVKVTKTGYILSCSRHLAMVIRYALGNRKYEIGVNEIKLTARRMLELNKYKK